MTRETYLALPRFPVSHSQDFWAFMADLKIPEGMIFECYTIHGTITYLCITDRIDNFLFDLRECDQQGSPVRCGYYRHSVNIRQIADCLYEGDWRFCLTVPGAGSSMDKR